MGMSSFWYRDCVIRKWTWTKCWLFTRFPTILKATVFLDQCLMNFMLKQCFISKIYKYVKYVTTGYGVSSAGIQRLRSINITAAGILTTQKLQAQ
jgi:hypothetical protein